MIEEKIADSKNKRGKIAKPKNASEAIAAFIATGFGSGLMPFAPGTFGSLVGVAIAYAIIVTHQAVPLLLLNGLLVGCVAFTLIGIWASDRAESLFARKDASQIVIDEVAGQLISYAFVAAYWPAVSGKLGWVLALGFGLFRLFDIFKPYPINHLQALTGGIGVMMDDVIAGLYAAVILSFVMYWL